MQLLHSVCWLDAYAHKQQEQILLVLFNDNLSVFETILLELFC